MSQMKQMLILVFMICGLAAAAQIRADSTAIISEWAGKVNRENPLSEYPRPQLTRKSWQNLNGLWQYSVLPAKDGITIPSSFQGSILVPFAIESRLSTVMKRVNKDQVLWYQRNFNVHPSMRKGRLLLHFGAVDWSCKVYVNNKQVGAHEGGYDSFSIDITEFLQKGTKQTISVWVWDPTDEGPQPRGKQVLNPKGIWYTPVTGIWQTVWLENVPSTYIVSTKQTPDIDLQQLKISVNTAHLQPGDEIYVSAWDGTAQVASTISVEGSNIVLDIPNVKLWSPAAPFLYDLKIAIKRKGKTIDEAGSYFGMRKSSLALDKNGVQRMMLNNQFVFQYGPLDQGWWPDGLYTAPTDDALKFDIEQTKALGFNMIRKHIKVEPARWYYYCDKIGMLVWQDMPGGDKEVAWFGNGYGWDRNPGMTTGRKLDLDRSPESEAIFRREWKAILDQQYNFPCIVSWILFNETMGQFKTRELADWTMKYDPSRLLNAASGGNYFFDAGQILDVHEYQVYPAIPMARFFGERQALVIGEFGGLGFPVLGHTWAAKNSWGYVNYKSGKELFDAYSKLIQNISGLIPMGLSAAVYTQTTDVEIETNGLFTYDRKVLKFPKERMVQLHEQLLLKSHP